jgi:hypothetical protein
MDYAVEYESEVRFELPITWGEYERRRREFERGLDVRDSLCICCRESCADNNPRSDRYWLVVCSYVPARPRELPKYLSACTKCVKEAREDLDCDCSPVFIDFAPDRTGARKSFKFDVLQEEND